MSDLPVKGNDVRRSVLLVAPLLIVAFAIGVLAVLLESSRGQQPMSDAVVAEVSTTTPSPPAPSAAPVRPTIALATPWGVLPANQPVATELPEEAPVSTVVPAVLLGPPPDSVFSAGSSVSFYWQWPGVLEEGQSFIVQAGTDGQWREIGRLDGVNLGQLFRLTVNSDAVGLDPGSYQWQVILESGAGEIGPIVAPPRPFTIVG